ncbi:MAG TPA: relaxase/mobilization nuclease domain-containing protein [Gillisia sp.]|nr:relaxase/mobilization nuclease domain-containing protein [Gillisia sp.]
MIAKAKSIGHGGRGIDYALKKENAVIIDKRMVVGDNGQEIKNEFRLFQNLNTRTTNNDISFVLSPEPKDGRKLSNDDFKAISEDFLKKMGLDKHQAITIKHTDKDHTHLHLFVNRIDTNGKAHNDSFISKKSQTVADTIAQERGLIRARTVQAFNQEMHKDIKMQIFQKHKAVLQHRPRDFKAYSELMQASGAKIIPTINKANRLQGYRVEFQGVNLKATEINRSMSLSKMGVNIKQTKGATLNTSLNLNPALKIGFKVLKTLGKGISRSSGIGY